MIAAAKPAARRTGVRATPRDDAEDDAQDVHQAVLAAEDHIAQPVGTTMALAMSCRGAGGAVRRGADGATESGSCPVRAAAMRPAPRRRSGQRAAPFFRGRRYNRTMAPMSLSEKSVSA